MTSLNSELVIDSRILINNINYIKKNHSKKSKFLAVIKSDAYGHHLENVARDINKYVDGFGVVRLDEAIAIRKVSNKKILLMQGVYTKEEFYISRKNNFDLVVHNNEQLKIIKENNDYKNLWLKINTGMNRLGFEVDDFLNVYDELLHDKDFTLMTHLASSNDANNPSNSKQFEIFDDVLSKLNNEIPKSVANTGCIFNFPERTYDWVRCGIGIYGGYINDEFLKTAMTLRSPIVNIKKIKKGESVGYDGRATAESDMKIASLYIGYADGLPVSIKDGTNLLVNGQIARIFGKISMDITTVDISNISNCKIGDWCEFFSPQFPISNIAKSNGLISYYFMTGIKSRVKKIYKRVN